jgi:Heterokaryon incompatibility protein (HET)
MSFQTARDRVYVLLGLISFLADIRAAQKFLGEPLLDYLAHTKLSEHTGSVECLQMACKWLRDCTRDHKCSVPRDATGFLPTRLLYLGPRSKQRQHHPEGCDSSMLQIHTQADFLGFNNSYTTLSHCWGGQGFVKLLSSNINDLRRQILLSSLPATFRDAILITQSLGFQYIWINSLCIIQDSIEDWTIEAGKMGEVY